MTTRGAPRLLMQKLPSGVAVADGGLLVDAENEGEMERVGAVREAFSS